MSYDDNQDEVPPLKLVTGAEYGVLVRGCDRKDYIATMRFLGGAYESSWVPVTSRFRGIDTGIDMTPGTIFKVGIRSINAIRWASDHPKYRKTINAKWEVYLLSDGPLLMMSDW